MVIVKHRKQVGMLGPFFKRKVNFLNIQPRNLNGHRVCKIGSVNGKIVVLDNQDFLLPIVVHIKVINLMGDPF